ncbi:hypothetical protein COCVIDRAFT_21052 [Bipolaris victoriae FI3]|uniref:Uncharacterized protein n=1 Tax=Bipolaris victoriae (strain FI3) TaxID=930091 RepID=W7E1R9_BIPV3|nr:hypothetical protein COCVIDRAFT_21052 [Bipolaris victoriae FI3]
MPEASPGALRSSLAGVALTGGGGGTLGTGRASGGIQPCIHLAWPSIKAPKRVLEGKTVAMLPASGGRGYMCRWKDGHPSATPTYYPSVPGAQAMVQHASGSVPSVFRPSDCAKREGRFVSSHWPSCTVSTRTLTSAHRGVQDYSTTLVPSSTVIATTARQANHNTANCR